MINLSAENGRTGSDEEDGEHTNDEGEDGAQKEAPPLPGTDLLIVIMFGLIISAKKTALFRDVKNNDKVRLLVCIPISISTFGKFDQFLKCLFLSLPLEQTRIVLR